MAKKDYVDVEVRLPNRVIANLDVLAAQGILGKSKEEVANHILKQALFEMLSEHARQDDKA